MNGILDQIDVRIKSVVIERNIDELRKMNKALEEALGQQKEIVGMIKQARDKLSDLH
jgi:hypothetical protein